MTHSKHGQNILQNVNSTPEGASLAVFIRHSIREPIYSPYDDAQLTPEGVKAALTFGESLSWKNPIVEISSGKKRCVDTAHLIAEGFTSRNPEVRVSFAPSESSLATMLHENVDHKKIDKIFGFISASTQKNSRTRSKAPASLIQYSDIVARNVLCNIVNELRGLPNSEMHLYVDHDWHLILLREHIFGTGYENMEWIDYLDGFLIMVDGASVIARNRDMRVTYPCNFVAGNHQDLRFSSGDTG